MLMLLVKGMSTFNQVPLIIIFTYYFMPMPLLLSLTKPLPRNTRYIPDNNFISGANYFKFWFVIVVDSAAIMSAYILLWSSPSYVHPKHYPIGITTILPSITQSTTLFLKIMLVLMPSIIFL